MSFAEVKPNPYLDKFYKGLDELAFGKDFMPTGLTSRPNMSYEECQASRDPRVLNMGDPCSGLPHSSFSDVQIEAYNIPAVDPGSFLSAFMGSMQGPMMAGSPSPNYSGIEKTANDALFRYGMDQTPRGATLRKNIEELRKRYNLYGQPRGI